MNYLFDFSAMCNQSTIIKDKEIIQCYMYFASWMTSEMKINVFNFYVTAQGERHRPVLQ